MADQKTDAKPEKKDAAAPAGATGTEPVVKRVKKGKKNVSTGNVYVLSSFNNTIVTITDPMGNAIAWSKRSSCPSSRA
jgi:ribosomal protein S11